MASFRGSNENAVLASRIQQSRIFPLCSGRQGMNTIVPGDERSGYKQRKKMFNIIYCPGENSIYKTYSSSKIKQILYDFVSGSH